MIHTEQLALAFAVELRQSFSDYEWHEMRLRNAEIGAGACASHDFCDANMVMDAAFAKVMGVEALVTDEHDNVEMPAWHTSIWNAAWAIAKRRYLTAITWEQVGAVMDGHIEQMGGGTTAWWVQLDHDHYALITHYEADHEGPADDPNWILGLYRDGHEDLMCEVDLTLEQALSALMFWKQELPGPSLTAAIRPLGDDQRKLADAIDNGTIKLEVE
jgi:hypothetical protein